MFVGSVLSQEDLKDILDRVAPDSVKRRMATPQLQKRYESRVNSWKK